MPRSVSSWLRGEGQRVSGLTAPWHPLFQLTFHSLISGTYTIYQEKARLAHTSILGWVDSLWVQRPLQIACGCSSYPREKMASGPETAGSLQGSASHPRAKATAALRCRTRHNLLNLSVIIQLLHLPQGLIIPESLNFPSLALWGAQSRFGFTTHPLSSRKFDAQR